MKVEFKLYRTFDADLISLHDNGIDIRDVMKMALEYFSRGKVLYFIVPECKPYNMIGHKRHIHLAMDVEDEESINFLKTQIKTRQRSAFLKAIVRAGLISPQVGPYLKRTDRIEQETDRIQELLETEPEYLENFTVLEFEEDFVRRSRKASDYPKKSDDKDQALPSGKEQATSANQVKDAKGDELFKNQFGDVLDLSVGVMKEKTKAEKAVEDTPKDQNIEETKTDSDVFEIDNDPFSEPNKEEQTVDSFEESPEEELQVSTTDTPLDSLATKDLDKEKEDEDKKEENSDDPFDVFSGLLGGY